MDKELTKALEALHVGADAIRTMKGVDECTADNDNDSGEIIFTVNGRDFRLKLEEITE
jgi:hypothetical protein